MQQPRTYPPPPSNPPPETSLPSTTNPIIDEATTSHCPPPSLVNANHRLPFPSAFPLKIMPTKSKNHPRCLPSSTLQTHSPSSTHPPPPTSLHLFRNNSTTLIYYRFSILIYSTLISSSL
ncbi:pectinesterase inhibitor 10-like [Lathyrus oleraceus]|uniref:pectinesterase inhibitor 10-like n=1 Tax=Pisum sativum TaxID=3888 RepID=UPI0021D3A015|nr:pectinesterase inhibitor 10-like [Pisum sativum]